MDLITFNTAEELQSVYVKEVLGTFDIAWKESEARIKAQMTQHLTIAFLGDIQKGKRDIISAIFSVDPEQIPSLESQATGYFKIPITSNCTLYNALRIHDATHGLPESVMTSLKESDIFVYTIDIIQPLQPVDRNEIAHLLSHDRPVLILLNQMDATPLYDRIEEYRTQLCREFDTLPEDYIIPISVQSLHKVASQDAFRVVSKLFDCASYTGKTLLIPKGGSLRKSICDKIIHNFVVTSTIAGAIPMGHPDIAFSIESQLEMIQSMSRIFQLEPTKDQIKPVFFHLIENESGLKIFQFIVELLKTVGWRPNAKWSPLIASTMSALIAGSITYSFGQTFELYFEQQMNVSFDTLQNLFFNSIKQFQDQELQS